MNQSCVNGCCRSKPCLNGGTCEEKCSDVREPYTCTCSKYYKGKRCEQFYPEVKSCQGVKIFRPGSHSGVYELVISDNKTVQSYCDFTSEAGKAWTLIESFSLSNKDIYKNNHFITIFLETRTTSHGTTLGFHTKPWLISGITQRTGA